MKRSKALWTVLAMAAGLAALAFALRGQYAHLAAEHLRGQLDTVSDDRASLLLGQVAELGDRGIPVLVEALGSQRESVARAGKFVIAEQLGEWELQSWQSTSRKLAILADALAERVDRFGPTARSDAAELAGRILRWRVDPRVVDTDRLLASCERVLRVTSAGGGWSSGPPLSVGPDQRGGARQAEHRPSRDRTPLQPDLSVADRSYMPGGGLSIPMEGRTEEPRQDDSPRTADVRSGRPLPLPAPPAAGSYGPLHGSQPPAAQQWPHPTAESDLPPTRLPSGGPVRPLSATEPPQTLSAHGWGDSAEVETTELMRRLRAEDVLTSGRARAELVRRGFQAVHLEMARRLFDPNPEVRKQLARSLTAQQGVDAIPWLLQLARDGSAEVRLTAIGLLATTGDPKLLQHLEALAGEDPDPRVRQQALGLARRRTGRRH